jgi:hypothetical protein
MTPEGLMPAARRCVSRSRPIASTFFGTTSPQTRILRGADFIEVGTFRHRVSGQRVARREHQRLFARFREFGKPTRLPRALGTKHDVTAIFT